MLVDERSVDCDSSNMSLLSSQASKPPDSVMVESSILDHIRELILQAKHYGCWKVGVGGIVGPPSDRYVSSVLQDLPVSTVLNCGIELWRNLEIDDDELLEIAIKDVSYQIRLNQENGIEVPHQDEEEYVEELSCSSSSSHQQSQLLSRGKPSQAFRQRFNPRVDPTVLYLEIKMLTFHLEKFLFRIEKHESKRTVFDPIFEGCGSLMVKNVSIKLRVDCVRQNVKMMGSRSSIPMLELRELDVQLEKVKLKVKDTGADWLLNKVVQGFEDSITEVVASNLND